MMSSDIANENWNLVLQSEPKYLIDGIDYDPKDIAEIFRSDFQFASRFHEMMKSIVDRSGFRLQQLPFQAHTNISHYFYLELFGKYANLMSIPTIDKKFSKHSCKKLGISLDNVGKIVDVYGTLIQLKKKFGNEMFVVLDRNLTAIFECGIIFVANIEYSGLDLDFFYDIDKVDCLRKILNSIKLIDHQKTNTINYITSTADGSYYMKELKVSNVGEKCDIVKNYSNDLPDKQIIEFLNSDESGIAIFHGEPGTGKTTYIRNLISRVGKQFIYINRDVLLRISENAMVNILLDSRDSIIVLEDCEEIISKDNGRSTCLTNLLNMSDGILGDSLKFKFICTFNVATSEIDPAIMRKGRMKVKYEFKKLSKEKTKALLEKLYPNEDSSTVNEMTLADIYNYKIDNGSKAKKNNTIGF